MTRIQLRLYVAPGQVDIYCNLKFKDNTYERLTAIVDTGAAVSLFPLSLLTEAEFRVSKQETVTIEQAGIAKQSFEAREAYVTITLEDDKGNLTEPFEILAWFSDNETAIIGFQDILDRAVLHIDMPQRTGWLEIDK